VPARLFQPEIRDKVLPQFLLNDLFHARAVTGVEELLLVQNHAVEIGNAREEVGILPSIEVPQRVRQPLQDLRHQRRDGLATQDSQLDVGQIDPLGRGIGAEGVEEDGRGDTLGQMLPGFVRRIQRWRFGLVPGDIRADNALVLAAHVTQELLAHGRSVQVQVARQNQVNIRFSLVEILHHVRQQPQHAPRALEGGERAPLLVEDINHIGVKRISQLHSLAEANIARFGRQITVMFLVCLGVLVDHLPHLRYLEVFHIEKPPPDHGVDLLALHRGLDALHPPEDLVQPRQRFLLPLAKVLQIAGGQRHHQHSPRQGGHGLGQFLEEGEGLGTQ